MSAFRGHLAASSLLSEVFPEGMIPLAAPAARLCSVGQGEAQQTVRAFLLDLDSCTPEQREALAALMSRMGQGPLEQVRAEMITQKEIPIREFNITAVSFPLRHVI